MPPVLGPASPSWAFVILGGLKGDDRAAVGDRQHAGLLALEPVLDNQPVAGVTKGLPPRDVDHRRHRLFAVVAH
jgi:hypothetical protein